MVGYIYVKQSVLCGLCIVGLLAGLLLTHSASVRACKGASSNAHTHLQKSKIECRWYFKSFFFFAFKNQYWIRTYNLRKKKLEKYYKDSQPYYAYIKI